MLYDPSRDPLASRFTLDLSLEDTKALLREMYQQRKANSIRPRLPNFNYPTIIPIRADAFVLDLSENRQRNPERRRKKLRRDFGEDGKLFNFDDFEVVTGLLREDGTVFPGAGMGRVYSTVHIVKRPDLCVPCLIKGIVGDQPEKRTFVHSMTNAAPISNAELFMTYGNMTGVEHELHRRYVAELNRLGLTTVPGGFNSVTLSAAVFALRLGTLEEGYVLARKWWFPEVTSKGIYKSKVEGSAMAACAAFVYLYRNQMNGERADRKFNGLDYSGDLVDGGIKATAVEKYTDPTTHQGRDDAPAVLRWMAKRYNSNSGSTKEKFTPLDWTDMEAIRDDFPTPAEDASQEVREFYTLMHDAWRMFDRAERSDS